MNTVRVAARLRVFGKPVLAGLLVLMLLVSAFASDSPCLHEWLHADHQSPTHYCLVTVLEHGQTDVVVVWVSPVSAPAGMPVAALPAESFFVSHDIALHPERGPPVLS
jgi:hypothetical protein